MKYRRLISLLVRSLAALSMALTCRADDTEFPTSASIMTGSIALQAGEYRYYQPKVDSDIMSNARIVGHLEASGGTGNDIDVFVLTETQFTNWKNNHETSALFNSGRSTAVDLDVTLERTGTYVLVISNAFSTVTPKTVAGTIDLRWEPSESVRAAQSASDMSAMLLLGALVVGVAAIGGLIVWFVVKRKRQSAGPA